MAIEKSPIDFGIISTARTLEEQKQKVAEGASKTLKSRHRWAFPVVAGQVIRTSGPYSFAWDYACWVRGQLTWEESYYRVVWEEAIKPASLELNIPVSWGGSWGWDFGHVQLSWKHYPAEYAVE